MSKGLLDELFDTNISDCKIDNKTSINYKPLQLSDFIPKWNRKKHKNSIVSNTGEKLKDTVKNVAKEVYLSSNEWCIGFKNTHIYNKCIEEILNSLNDRVGIKYCDFIECINIEWGDYWYDTNNHRHYTLSQLKRIEKEIDKDKDSEELCYEMISYIWNSIIPKSIMDDEIDENGIYKLSVRLRKDGYNGKSRYERNRKDERKFKSSK